MAKIEGTIRQADAYGFPHDTILYDKEGVTLKVGLLDGKIVPPFGQKSVSKVRNMAMRDDDILLVGYPKTGSHWTWEILRMILYGRAENSPEGKLAYFLELASEEYLEGIPARRIMNTHLWWNNIPQQAIEKKTKIVFTVRNPKDTAVSFYNHHRSLEYMYGYNGSFENWFSLFIDGQVDYGSYFDYHQEWDTVIKNNPSHPILVLWFEDMSEDLPREIRKMAEFVEVTLSDTQVEKIARAANFVTMKKAYSKISNASNVLLRKGQVGDWKNWLTVAQSELVDKAVEDKLAGTLFSHPRYTLYE